jgi:hypothetical protein
LDIGITLCAFFILKELSATRQYGVTKTLSDNLPTIRHQIISDPAVYRFRSPVAQPLALSLYRQRGCVPDLIHIAMFSGSGSTSSGKVYSGRRNAIQVVLLLLSPRQMIYKNSWNRTLLDRPSRSQHPNWIIWARHTSTFQEDHLLVKLLRMTGFRRRFEQLPQVGAVKKPPNQTGNRLNRRAQSDGRTPA